MRNSIKLFKEWAIYRIMEDINTERDLTWLFHLKDEISLFLRKLKGKKRSGFYRYSLSGDYFGEKIKWGLGNSVFFLKIIYTLGLENQFSEEIKNAINFITSFQRKDGTISDPLVNLLTWPRRILNFFKTLDFRSLSNEPVKRAETRQSISALSLFNFKSKFEYKKIPMHTEGVKKFLLKLNWEIPWGAGSHFSHLLFFLQHSKLSNKKELIQEAIDWVNELQHDENGFWYQGNPSIQQKVNGVMKIITGLKVTDRVNFKYPEKLIDSLLEIRNDRQACDNFNIVYVLKYCNELTRSNYRFKEIKEFFFERLKIYKQFYFPKLGGFSFRKNRANRKYYGAILTKGKKEPDIHGTIMFLWGISIIAQTLGINKKLQFYEHIT